MREREKDREAERERESERVSRGVRMYERTVRLVNGCRPILLLNNISPVRGIPLEYILC